MSHTFTASVKLVSSRIMWNVSRWSPVSRAAFPARSTGKTYGSEIDTSNVVNPSSFSENFSDQINESTAKSNVVLFLVFNVSHPGDPNTEAGHCQESGALTPGESGGRNRW